jgi:tetratricopeptide (TPR) repeat protein
MKDKIKQFLNSISYYHQLINDYKRAVSTSPDHAMAYVNWGVELAVGGKLEDSLEKFEKASNIAPKRFEPFLNWGITLSKAERFEEAADKFKLAHLNAPKLALPLVLWGSALMEAKAYEDAKEKYKKAIALAPNHSEPYSSWSIGLAKAGFYNEALVQLKKSLSLYSQQPRLYFLWGAILADLEQHHEAIEKFKINLQFHYDNPEAYYFWSACLLSLEKYKEALEKSEEAIRLYKGSKPEIYIHHGEIHGLLGRYDLAISSYQQALQLDESLSEAYRHWGIALCKQGHYQQGYKQFQKCLDKNSQNVAWVHAHWGQFLVEEMQYGMALEHLDFASQQALEEDSTLLLSRAVALLNTQQPEQGIAVLERLLALDKWNVKAHFLMGTFYLNQNDFTVAKKHFLSVLSEQPDFQDAALSLAVVYCEEGNVQEAIRQIRPLYRKHPDQVKVNFYYGVILYQDADYRGALLKYQAALEGDKHHAGATTGMAECMIQLQNYPEAILFVENALSNAPPENLSALHYLCGVANIRQSWVSLEQNPSAFSALPCHQSAFSHLEKALALQPQHLGATLNLLYVQGVLQNWQVLHQNFQSIDLATLDGEMTGMMYYLWACGLRYFNQADLAAEKFESARSFGYIPPTL